MESPNPYKPPGAPVDGHTESVPPQSLRLLLRVLTMAQLALIPIVVAMPDTLPAELRQLRDEREMAFLNAHGAIAMLSIVLLIASLFGLWWEKRWAVWMYVAANVIGYGLQLASGVRISSDIASMIDSFADAAIGATLVVLYLGGYFSSRREAPATPR